MEKHGTEGTESFRHFILEDLFDRITDSLVKYEISMKEVDQRLGWEPGQTESAIRGMSDISVEDLIQMTRKYGLKPALFAYDDGDPDNTLGPIFAEVFLTCWKMVGKPRDFFELKEAADRLGVNPETLDS